MNRFPIRLLLRPFSYIYKRLVEIVRKKRVRSDSVSPILVSESESESDSQNKVVNDDTLQNPIRPPFPLRIRIPTERDV